MICCPLFVLNLQVALLIGICEILDRYRCLKCFCSFSSLFCCCLLTVLMSVSLSVHTNKLKEEIERRKKERRSKKPYKLITTVFAPDYDLTKIVSLCLASDGFILLFYFAAKKDRQLMFYWQTTLAIVYQSVVQFQERRVVLFLPKLTAETKSIKPIMSAPHHLLNITDCLSRDFPSRLHRLCLALKTRPDKQKSFLLMSPSPVNLC